VFTTHQTDKGYRLLRDLGFLLKNCRFHLMAPYINAFVVSFGFLSTSKLSSLLSIDTALVFLFSALHTGSIYSLNNVYDVEADKRQVSIDKGYGRWNLSAKNQVALGNISKKKAAGFSAVLFCLSALFFYLKGGLLPAFLATAIFVWAWAYSAPPLKFKNRFVLDLVLHGLFWGSFLFLTGYFMKKSVDPLFNALPSIVLIFLSSVLWELHNYFEDYYADKEAGNLTSVVRLGLRRSFYVYLLVLGTAIAYSLLLALATWPSIAFLGAMVLYLVSGLWVARRDSLKTMFLPRKHFYMANLLIFVWMAGTLYFG